MIPSTLTTRQVAEILNLKPNTLEIWRMNNIGPSYIKMGKIIRYELSEIERFIEASKKTI